MVALDARFRTLVQLHTTAPAAQALAGDAIVIEVFSPQFRDHRRYAFRGLPSGVDIEPLPLREGEPLPRVNRYVELPLLYMYSLSLLNALNCCMHTMASCHHVGAGAANSVLVLNDQAACEARFGRDRLAVPALSRVECSVSSQLPCGLRTNTATYISGSAQFPAELSLKLGNIDDSPSA